MNFVNGFDRIGVNSVFEMCLIFLKHKELKEYKDFNLFERIK